MSSISHTRTDQFLSVIRKSASPNERGFALEELLCDLFKKIPGLSITKRNEDKKFEDRDIEIIFWNEQKSDGFYFLPNIIPIGAHRWLEKIEKEHIKWFLRRLKERGLSFGILIATNGLAEDEEERSLLRQQISLALNDERQILILKGKDFEKISSAEQLVTLVKEKLCELAVA